MIGPRRMEWFRSYHGAPDDPKWLVVARRANTIPGIVGWLWWKLEDYASQSADRGSVAGFDFETAAALSGFDEPVLREVYLALQAKGCVTGDDHLSAWRRRNPIREDESAVERKRRQREREAESVTHGHDESRDVPPRGEGEGEGEGEGDVEEIEEPDKETSQSTEATAREPRSTSAEVGRFCLDVGCEWKLQVGIAEWSAGLDGEPKFAALDIPYEVSKCREYNIANRKRPKAPNQALRNWLEKATEFARAGPKSNGNGRHRTTQPQEYEPTKLNEDVTWRR